MRVLATALLLIIFAVELTACKRSPSSSSTYGFAYNSQRQALGLPIIPPTWTLSDDLGTQLRWVNPLHVAGRPGPRHAYKQLNLTTARIPDYELDEYYSGKEFKNSSGDSDFEAVQILYRFSKKTAGQSPWEVSATLPNHREISTLQEAEALLSSWGLKRLSSSTQATTRNAN